MTTTRTSPGSLARKTMVTAKKKWSRKVTEYSHALDIEKGVFAGRSPEKIAASLKRSVTRSSRRKSTPYQSAMSMLNFYINRGGKNFLHRGKKYSSEPNRH